MELKGRKAKRREEIWEEKKRIWEKGKVSSMIKEGIRKEREK